MTEADPGAFPLPDFPLEDDIAEMVEAIGRSAGADPVAVALQGVEVFIQLSHKRLDRPMEISAEIRGLCRALARAKLDCAPLVNLANDMIKPFEDFYGRGEGERMRADLRERAEGWREELFALERQRILQAAQLVQPNARVVLFGHETDLVDALRQARAAGVEFAAASVEGPNEAQPGALAEALHRFEIPVESVRLEEAAALIDGSVAVLLGAYGLAMSGLVHWAGTSNLARAAQAQQIAVHCLCGPERFFPFGCPVSLPDEGQGKEGVAGMWEVTPLGLLTSVVTGEAMLTADTLREALTQHPLIPSLLG